MSNRKMPTELNPEPRTAVGLEAEISEPMNYGWVSHWDVLFLNGFIQFLAVARDHAPQSLRK
jgi:hypothetical protein